MSGAIDTAVIMAAGVGIRLGSIGYQIPKGFLRLGGAPIVQESIERLMRAGISRIIVVTGHLPEYYQELQMRYPSVVELVHNYDYAVSGSMYSLYCARHRVSDDFLLLESDIVYEQRALTTLLQSPSRDIVLCSGPTRSDDEVWISTRRNRLRGMSKDRDALDDPVLGELVGICRISSGLFRIMCEEAERCFRRTLHMAYETDCLVVAARRHQIECLRVDDLVWCEIDHEQHLSRARSLIYPALTDRSKAATG